MMKNRTHWRYLTKHPSSKQCSIRCSVVFLSVAGLLALQGIHAYAAGNGYPNNVLHHRIEVSLQPSEHRLAVTDRITVPPSLVHNGTVQFLLHDGLVIDAPAERIERIPASTGRFRELAAHADVPLVQYRLSVKNTQQPITIQYHGEIDHTLDSQGGGTPGLIGEQGVFLAHSSGWYPIFDDNELLTFSMTVRLPTGWSAVSQGMPVTKGKPQPGEINWTETHPQDDIYLVASQFHQYSDKSSVVDAMVFLRSEDRELAEKYMQATVRYIDMYNQLIGPYPYGKFALVENFWETGYGMPSFTLMGPRVIRLPFIIYSSYPHEILHNYWGNGVYADYQSGNWAEGLTAYLADHLLKEQRGHGAEYRRSVLQKYTDYVSSGRDFPLTEFRSRHDSATEAVGYGKTLMLFHMLRMRMGDEAFLRAIRSFYRQYRFRVASFADIQRVFSDTAGRSLDKFFEQWVQRTGSPKLELDGVRREVKRNRKGQETPEHTQGEPDQYRVIVNLKQAQSGAAYRLQIPMVVYLQGRQSPYQQTVSMLHKQQRFSIVVPGRPLAVDVDPRFDLFRRLDSRELPAALSQGLGAERPLMVLPSKAEPEIVEGFKKLAKQWQQRLLPSLQVVTDDSLDQLPNNRSVWLAGWGNRFRDAMTGSLQRHNVTITNQSFVIGNKEFDKKKFSILLTARHPRNKNKTLLWLATENAVAITGLARKLPHYGKYSYLVFEGEAPDNVAKGQWLVNDSPMRIVFDKKFFDFSALLKPHQPLMMPSR